MPFGIDLGDFIPGPFDDWLIDQAGDLITGLFDENGNGNGTQNGNGQVRSSNGVARVNGRSNGVAHTGPVDSRTGCVLELPLAFESRARCAPGYVAVDKDGDGIPDTCMLKAAAVKCGLYSSRPKPPISASDWRTLKRSNAVVNRVDRIAEMANNVTGRDDLVRKKTTRRRPAKKCAS